MIPVFIGDEVTAAAYRLAGLDVRIAAPATTLARFRDALAGRPPAILVTAACAEALPADVLDAALLRCDPPVVVVTDAAARAPLPDYGTRVRAVLGIAE